METETIISSFIRDELLRGDDEGMFVPDVSLVSTGILDSVSVLKLLVFIEERFRVKIADEELTPANFDTLDRIAAFINSKTAALPL